LTTEKYLSTVREMVRYTDAIIEVLTNVSLKGTVYREILNSWFSSKTVPLQPIGTDLDFLLSHEVEDLHGNMKIFLAFFCHTTWETIEVLSQNIKPYKNSNNLFFDERNQKSKISWYCPLKT